MFAVTRGRDTKLEEYSLRRGGNRERAISLATGETLEPASPLRDNPYETCEDIRCLPNLSQRFGDGAKPLPPPFPTSNKPLVPTEAQPGGAGFTLTINGTGFVPTPTDVLFGGTKLTITSSTATQLKVTVPMASIAAAGTASVSVQSLIDGEIPVRLQPWNFPDCNPASPQFRRSPVLTALAVRSRAC